MLHLTETDLTKMVMHRVGNKLRDEEIRFSKSPVNFDYSVKDLLLRYFLSSFRSTEYYNLYHESDTQLNVVFNHVSQIFDDPENLYSQSIHLARHLYDQSTHPRVKDGEFYVVYFTNCVIDGEVTDAVGMFKSETKETFLKVYPTEDNFSIEYEDGININRLDKGCLIVNTERDRGYLVSIVDNLSKITEAQYWRDHFLQVRQRTDNFYQTENMMRLCKQFVTEKLPEEFDVTRADQADFLLKSSQFLKENEDFEMNNFADEVFHQPEIKNTFDQFRTQYEEEMDLELSDNFKISEEAVKKQARYFKSVIKLDKNFHIYVHGKRERIVKGYDEERGLNFYQLFFDHES